MMTSQRTIAAVVISISMLVVASTVLFTNSLANDLRQEEQRHVQIWAEAMRQLVLADESTDIDFVTTVIEQNNTIPVCIADADGRVLLSRNFLSEDERIDVSSLSGPIELTISSDNVQFIYYDESNLLHQLRYLPYAQAALILIFIAISIVALLTVHRSEQNKLWAGLSKETAHQLGTPISALNGWQSLLMDKYPDDLYVPQMRRDIDRLQTIADRFSKIGSAPALTTTSVNSLIDSAVDYMRPRLSNRAQIEFVPAQDEPLVMASRPLLEWVVENLLKNAIDAHASQIAIRMQSAEHEVVIDVVDDGCGMDSRTQRRIFQAGFTTKSRGWGLGLPLAKRIVEKYHAGKLLLKHSKVGSGSTFRIVLKKAK